MNPALTEMVAKDRITELHAAAAKRAARNRPSLATEIVARPASSHSSRRFRLTNPQQAIGWFLVSLGLRLAVPRTRTGSAR